MVRNWRFMAGLLLVLPALAFGARLEIDLDRTQTELGHAISAEIRGDGLAESLHGLSVQSLEQDFGVVIHEYSSSGPTPDHPAGESQLLTLRLYPRRTGRLMLSALRLGELRTTTHAIDVSDGATGGKPITLATSVSSASVWARQQVIVQVEITTPDRFASLHVDPVDVPGFEAIPLPPSRQHANSGGEARTVLRAGWALFALTAGSRSVALPPIKYRLGGKFQRVYYLPHVQLDVQALPPYLPPVIPVGRVSMTSTLESPGLLNTGEVAYWNLTLSGDALPPHWLPPVLRQIKPGDRLDILPAESRRTATPDNKGVHGRTVHQIPVKPLANGWLALPQIRIQYFDPDSGRLVTVAHAPPAAFVLSTAWRFTLGALFVLLAFVIGARLLRYLRGRLHYRRKRREALECLADAQDTPGLRRALAMLADAEDWPGNQSISAWAVRWRRRFRTGPGFPALLARLSSACYSAVPDPDLTGLKHQLLQVLAAPRRL